MAYPKATREIVTAHGAQRIPSKNPNDYRPATAHSLVRARIALDVALSNLARWPGKAGFVEAVEKAEKRVEATQRPINAATSAMLKMEKETLFQLREEMNTASLFAEAITG